MSIKNVCGDGQERKQLEGREAKNSMGGATPETPPANGDTLLKHTTCRRQPMNRHERLEKGKVTFGEKEREREMSGVRSCEIALAIGLKEGRNARLSLVRRFETKPDENEREKRFEGSPESDGSSHILTASRQNEIE